jgi:predicted ATPase
VQGTATGVETAAHLFLRAQDEAHRQGALSWKLRAATSRARLLRYRDGSADAVASLQPIYDRFTEGFGTADLVSARQLLDDLTFAGHH